MTNVINSFKQTTVFTEYIISHFTFYFRMRTNNTHIVSSPPVALTKNYDNEFDTQPTRLGSIYFRKKDFREQITTAI